MDRQREKNFSDCVVDAKTKDASKWQLQLVTPAAVVAAAAAAHM